MKVVRTSSIAAQDSCSSTNLLTRSLLYLELKAEREEILKHKWIESQKMGKDIGFNFAVFDWRVKHRAGWRKWWRQHYLPSRSVFN